MTEQERKYYEELKANPKDWNFDTLFNMNEKGEAITKEGTWFRLMGDGLPMFFPTIQKRIDLLNEVTTSTFQNKSSSTQIPLSKMTSIFEEEEAVTNSTVGNSIFDFEKDAGINSKLGNWYEEAIKKHNDSFGNKLLQISLIQIPKTFNDTLKFEITTTISKGEKITVTINDVDSIFSNKPDKNIDAQLYSIQYAISDKNVFSIKFTEEMQKKAFSDVEFELAECYIKVTHSKITDVYSNVFNVQKTIVEDKNAKNKESWSKKLIQDLIKNGLQGKLDPNRNGDFDCLKAFASNLRTLYKDNSPKNIPTNQTMSDAVKSLNSKYLSSKIVIAPKYQDKRLTTKSFTITDTDELLYNVEPNIEKKLLEITKSGQVCVFAVGIAAEYHSTVVVVSKDENYKIDIGSENGLIGTYKNPLFLFIEDGEGCLSRQIKELDIKVNRYLATAYLYYSGQKKLNGKFFKHPEKDTSLDAHIFQLYDPTKLK